MNNTEVKESPDLEAQAITLLRVHYANAPDDKWIKVHCPMEIAFAVKLLDELTHLRDDIEDLKDDLNSAKQCISYSNECDEMLWEELGAPLCEKHGKHCYASCAHWLVEEMKGLRAENERKDAEIQDAYKLVAKLESDLTLKNCSVCHGLGEFVDSESGGLSSNAIAGKIL
jgi:hypothetical protein